MEQSPKQNWNADASDFVPSTKNQGQGQQQSGNSGNKAGKKKGRKKGVAVDVSTLFSFNSKEEKYVPNEHIFARKKPVQHVYFDKEQFMQANFRVCINRIPDDVILRDPDYVSPWEAIDLMIYPVAEDYQCPICLDTELVAEQMSRCGHVFCWPCIIRYKATTDKPWVKCPLCFEPIRLESLFSVKLEKQRLIKEGDEITMNLMVRNKSSIIPYVAKEVRDNPGRIFENKFPPYEEKCHNSRICVLSDKTETLIKERAALESAKEYALSLGDTDGIIFIEQAIEYLCVKEERYIETHQFTSSISSGHGHQNHRHHHHHQKNEDETPEPESSLPEIEWTSDLSFFYFQIDNGENYYLDALDTKVLVEEYGDYSKFPDSIQSTIKGIDHCQQTAEIRKRHKKIQHLPLNAFIYFLNIDLKPLVSAQTYRKFKKEIDNRDRARQKKTETEDKNKKKQDRIREKKFYASVEAQKASEWTGISSSSGGVGGKEEDLVSSGTFAFNWPGIGGGQNGSEVVADMADVGDHFDEQYGGSGDLVVGVEDLGVQDDCGNDGEPEEVEEFPQLGDLPALGGGGEQSGGRKKSGAAKKSKESAGGSSSWSGLFDGKTTGNSASGKGAGKTGSLKKGSSVPIKGDVKKYSDDEDEEYDRDYVAKDTQGVNAFDHMYVKTVKKTSKRS
mmetsp:Transcript_54257/g.62150  ORF Transcript_54257/g.62150 Transcript_54257/m.62150 type:complete len:674 (-) Transcript_54257:99-2120(-)